ncbi:hypothetical protein BSKO_08563 [Bryopsis sp. KO-2023]|nr:hypothetical protein BSKO_08563 [Bryopsis sp. KO-2023]
MAEGTANPDADEAYVVDDQGNVIDGVVVADLEGQQGEDDQMQEDGNEQQGGDGELNPEQARDDSIHAFEGHKGSVFGVAWSRNGDGVCSGGEDDLAASWKVITDANHAEDLETRWLRGHSDSVVEVEFNAGGDLLATAGMDGLVKIWVYSEGSMLQSLDGPAEAMEWIDWHPKGDVILGGSADFTMWMWNARNGACMQVFTGHSAAVSCGGFTPDGRLVVSCGSEGDPSMKIWDPKNGNCTATIEGHGYHEDGITCIDFSADGTLALTGSMDGTARLAHLQSGKARGTLIGHTESVECVCFSEGSLPLIVTGSLDGKAKVWDQSTLTQRRSLTHPQGVTAMKTLPQSNMFITGCLDGVVRAWDMRMDNCVREYHGFQDGVLSLALSPNAKYVLAGSDDHSVRVFEL